MAMSDRLDAMPGPRQRGIVATEGDAIQFWDEWMKEHPEQEAWLQANLNALIEGVKKKQTLKVYGFGIGAASLVLLELFRKGFLPVADRE